MRAAAVTGGIVLELAVAEMEERGEQPKERMDLVAGAAQVGERGTGGAEGARVVDGALGGRALPRVGGARLAQDAVVARRAAQPQLLDGEDH